MVASCIGFLVLYFVFRFLFGTKLKHRTPSQQFLTINYAVSIVYGLQHTILNAIFHNVLPSHYGDPENEFTSHFDRIACSITIGYFVYDMIALTYHQITIPNARKETLLIFHHVVAMLGFIYAITQSRHCYYLLQVSVILSAGMQTINLKQNQTTQKSHNKIHVECTTTKTLYQHTGFFKMLCVRVLSWYWYCKLGIFSAGTIKSILCCV